MKHHKLDGPKKTRYPYRYFHKISLRLKRIHTKNTKWSEGKTVSVHATKACRGSSSTRSYPRCYMQVSGYRRVLATLHRWSTPGTHWIGAWVGHTAYLYVFEKRKIPSPCPDSNPDTSRGSPFTVSITLSVSHE